LDYSDKSNGFTVTEHELFQGHLSELVAEDPLLVERLPWAVWAIARDPEGGDPTMNIYLQRIIVSTGPETCYEIYYQTSGKWIELSALYKEDPEKCREWTLPTRSD
jgi:hypothetical protein